MHDAFQHSLVYVTTHVSPLMMLHWCCDDIIWISKHVTGDSVGVFMTLLLIMMLLWLCTIWLRMWTLATSHIDHYDQLNHNYAQHVTNIFSQTMDEQYWTHTPHNGPHCFNTRISHFSCSIAQVWIVRTCHWDYKESFATTENIIQLSSSTPRWRSGPTSMMPM